ncbi:hypothetical protein SAMN04490357_1008 [Streptomyces misionensis]|uniref:Uncharacterized protein n=1 Tax=Streptomyces misionensis TaxID=67331 RepID=A0A1H4P721_9ACTN|nr:hypothetical protein [Streptomyces misionensis]SEC03189.1 hypothetical protein SAMN04490357_1008 [Streptomyces misionensis]
MNPADELAAAADKLRALATAVSAPEPALQPFHAEGCDVTQGRTPGLYDVATTQTPELANYIAAMDPTVGLALADWLETTAAKLNHSTHPGWQDHVEPHALTVARAILGGQP